MNPRPSPCKGEAPAIYVARGSAMTLTTRVPKLPVMTITMFGADWCGDCRRAEKFFVDNNIEFQKIDLELDENEHFVESEVLRRNNGKKSIPVIVFDDDSHLTEPTNAQLAEKLGLPKY